MFYHIKFWTLSRKIRLITGLVRSQSRSIPGRPESEKEPVVITIDDEEEDQEVRKKPIVTAQDDGEEEEPPAKKHKLCRDLLKRQLT